MSDDKKVIFSMSGVNKTYQSTNKQVLNELDAKRAIDQGCRLAASL